MANKAGHKNAVYQIGEEIGKVEGTRAPYDAEFFGDAVLDPEVSHVDGARPPFFDSFVGKCDSR